MKAILRMCLCALLGGLFLPANVRAVLDQRDPGGGDHEPDKVLVKFKSGVAWGREEQLHKAIGAEPVRTFPALRLQVVKLPNGLSVAEAVERYKADPRVDYAEPDYRVTVQATPNDPRFGELWGLNNAGQSGGVVDADIDAPEAWSLLAGDGAVVVATIDTGIDYNHPDLSANVWVNPGEIAGNGVDDDGDGYVDDVHGIDAFSNDGDPWDDNGHGTHVAGILGAAGNNGIGVAGVSWRVKVMSCKFLNAGGVGDISDAIECLQYIKLMKDRGVNVVATNNSWGGVDQSQALYDAIAAQREILFVAAAGNNGTNDDTSAFYPASYDLPNLIAVAATNRSDALSTFSNSGKDTVHVAAPGESILSTLPDSNYWNIPGGYGTLSGTSMAAPHVSGLAALIKSQDQSRDWRAIKNLVLSGGDPLAALENRTVTGRRVNAFGSVGCANRRLIRVVRPPEAARVGVPAALSVLSINCGSPAGPVHVTTSAGDGFDLSDDGVAPDAAAGDGIFSGSFTPARDPEKLDLASPAGTMTITVPPLYIGHYVAEANTRAPYRQTLAATGAKAPYTWFLVSGNLPPGLALDSATGEISGIPALTGSFPFTVRVRDAWGVTATRALSLRVGNGDIVEDFAKTLHGSGSAYGKDVARDRAGNLYVLGRLGSANTVSKYASSGALLWHERFGAGYLRAIALDRAGALFVAGGTAVWDSGDTLLMKLDPSGGRIWERTYDNGVRTDLAMDVAVDASGNAYLAGIAENGSRASMFVQRIDASGNALWTRRYSAGFADYGYAVDVDEAGNACLGGSSAVGVPEGGGTIYAYDFLIRKYDAAGTLIWSRSFDTGSRYDTLSDLKTDGDGNVYALGTPAEQAFNGFVTMKFGAAGNFLWERDYRAVSHQSAGLAVDGSGNVYASGASWGEAGHGDWDYLTLKYDGSGSLLWKKVTDGGYYLSEYHGDYAYGIDVDANGRICVTGASYNGVDGSDMLTVEYSAIGSGAVCVGPGAANCDDANACTVDRCDPSTGCVFTAAARPCDDGNACTTDDTCDNAGRCVAGPARTCADDDPCTANDCDPAIGCVVGVPNLDATGFSASRIDGRDLSVLAAAWNSCPGDARYVIAANLDRGATLPGACIDATDFHLFMNAFGRNCP